MANFNYNRVMLGGRLTNDPELRQTQSGTPMATFTVAVNRRGRGNQQDQNQQPAADFFRCIAWRNSAEFVTRYFRKGSSIFVSGNIQNNNWTDQQGVKHYSTDILVDDVQFVDSRSENPAYQNNMSSPAGGYGAPAQQNQAASYTPSSYTSPGFGDSGDKEPSFEELSEDDSLPF
jgi:single-strand DNA-binding protein